MIRAEAFVKALERQGVHFYAGVPDSLLKNLCAYLTDNIPPERNIITANEGAAVALGAGHYLATGEPPVIYMQNSGQGNAINPLLSLTDTDVYAIPELLLIGWRGRPGVHDEPQHVKQGRVTTALLDAIGMRWAVLSRDEAEMERQVSEAVGHMQATGECYALIVEKDTFKPYSLSQATAPAELTLTREECIGRVAAAMGDDDCVVSTTGMISRELFEHRTHHGQGHERDFLTVGSMGHASQIALGIAMARPERRVWCLDGDGAVLMHMGSMAIIGTRSPQRLVHVVLNNGAHDSVGGQPTAALGINLPAIARACGYPCVISVCTAAQLDAALAMLDQQPHPVLLEIKVKKGHRKDLGRPTTTPQQNKDALMAHLRKR